MAAQPPIPNPYTGVVRIVLTYSAFAALWILLSDKVVGLLFSDPAKIVAVSMMKGWLFVAITALLLLGLLRRLVGQLQDSHQRQIESEIEKRRALHLLATISDSSADAIFAKDPLGRYLLFNRAASEFVGKAAADVIGRDDRAIFPPEQAERLMAIDRRVLAEGGMLSDEGPLHTTDGERIFLATKGVLRDGDADVSGVFGISRDVTEARLSERAIRESEEKLQLFIEHAPASLAMFDRDMRYLAVSRRWLEDHSLGAREILGLSHYEVFPDVSEQWRDTHRRGLAGEVIRSEEERLERPDGSVRWSRWEVRPWYANDGAVGGIVIFSEDITEHKQAEAELRIAATAFESQQAMLITDRNQTILRVNQAFTAVTGYCAAEAVGKSIDMLRAGRQDPAFWQSICDEMARNRLWQGEIWGCRKSGETFPAWLSISEVAEGCGTVTNYIGSFVDISQRKQAEELIHSLSYYDALTGLPNRRLLLDRLKQTVLSNKRSRHHGAILFIDLDGFRALNDTRGHDVGDELLVGTSRRIRSCVHGEDTVARLGSDEFAVVLEGLNSEQEVAAVQAREVAKRVHDSIRQPIDLAGQEYLGTARIGISLFSARESTVEELLKLADASMFQAKRTGRNQIHFFDAGMQAALEERVQMESWLRKALPDQLQLHYQMQVDSTGRVFGAEALIRWQHPQRGLISPATFIPLAEETGLILPIGRWVLETACRQLKAWEANPATRHMVLAVNVSAKQFQKQDFVEEVLEVVGSTGANPANLKLELTESTLLENIDVVVEKMVALKAKGIRFSLDDFGTGFSSLSYLNRLPLEQLKIDQSFVRDVLAKANDAAIVRTIIALGQSLGLDVIAEGVETDEQRNFLATHGCNYFQGYFFGRPLPLAEFESRLFLR